MIKWTERKDQNDQHESAKNFQKKLMILKFFDRNDGELSSPAWSSIKRVDERSMRLKTFLRKSISRIRHTPARRYQSSGNKQINGE